MRRVLPRDARRLTEWSLWLDERRLAPVAHRQGVLTLPKRLRAYFLHDRRRLGRLSRVAARTRRADVPAAVGEREAVPGVIRRILAHLERRGVDARAGPWAGVAAPG
ncbi:MAG: hypothetical protein HZC42_09195 [Candidatus Eisenbacteria bacterium]|nr:hypothetical protein [Candidatus Eisenbacteria bacterium]